MLYRVYGLKLQNIDLRIQHFKNKNYKNIKFLSWMFFIEIICANKAFLFLNKDKGLNKWANGRILPPLYIIYYLLAFSDECWQRTLGLFLVCQVWIVHLLESLGKMRCCLRRWYFVVPKGQETHGGLDDHIRIGVPHLCRDCHSNAFKTV